MAPRRRTYRPVIELLEDRLPAGSLQALGGFASTMANSRHTDNAAIGDIEITRAGTDDNDDRTLRERESHAKTSPDLDLAQLTAGKARDSAAESEYHEQFGDGEPIDGSSSAFNLDFGWETEAEVLSALASVGSTSQSLTAARGQAGANSTSTTPPSAGGFTGPALSTQQDKSTLDAAATTTNAPAKLTNAEKEKIKKMTPGTKAGDGDSGSIATMSLVGCMTEAVRDGFDASTLVRGDDNSVGPVALGFDVNFYGQIYNSVYVNQNGNVTFDGPLGAYTPTPMSSITHPILAPYFADVDTRNLGSGVTTYGAGTVDGHSAFGVTWDGVGYYNQHADKLNRFQLVLIDRSDVGPGNFDVEFNYCTVTWETGDANGGMFGVGGQSAHAGLSSGTGAAGTYFALEGAGVNGAYLDSNPVTGLVHRSLNNDAQGRYAFEFRGGYTTIVSIQASDALAAETGSNLGEFTITRTGDLSSSLTVHLSVAGTALSEADYVPFAQSVVIPISAASVSFPLVPLDDVFAEGNETVVVSLNPTFQYQRDVRNTATVTILDDLADAGPALTAFATDSVASEAGSNDGEFTIYRSGDWSDSLTVYYELLGTATSGSDIAALNGEVTIPAGLPSTSLDVSPYLDAETEGDETVWLVLLPSPDESYTLSYPGAAVVTIYDLLPVVGIEAKTPFAHEFEQDKATFVVWRTGDVSTSLTLQYSIGGAAVNGTDYSLLSGSKVIPAGEYSAVIDVTPIDDAAIEDFESVVLTLSSDAAYVVSPEFGSASAWIGDDDAIPSIEFDYVERGVWELVGTTLFWVSLSSIFNQTVSAQYTVTGGTATGDGTDYTLANGTLTFAPGEWKKAIPVAL